jgi:serine protease Do
MNVKIGRLPDEKILATTNNRGPERTSGALGLTLAPLDAASRRAAGLDAGTDGVLITDLQRDSSLVEKGVEPGAVLLAVAGVPVNSPSAAAAAIAKAEKSGRSAVLLLVRQNGNDRFVAGTLKKD